MDHLLLPTPHRLERRGGELRLDTHLTFRTPDCGGKEAWVARRLSQGLERLGLKTSRVDHEPVIDLTLDGDAPPESYRLSVGPEGARISAPDTAGLFYGVCTWQQWLLSEHRRAEGALLVPGVEIEDRPAFAVRGVMLDVSRNKVPTLETLFGLVDLLAGWKFNHLQLYLEHTFAYSGHQAVWEGWSPLTPSEISRLDDYCKQRFVELAPNQNSFGHFHRWLVHSPYRQLAECPEGIQHPFDDQIEPFSLCPLDPGSLELLEDLYDQLLPCFTSLRFNVGLDETFDLGQGRSAAACESRGRGRVYLDFLHDVHRLVDRRSKQMLFWGDIVLEHPELVPELPADAVPLLWGYEANHPFEEQCRRFAEAGAQADRSFWICPGTSSWLSFAGRTDNAIGNLRSAARHGQKTGAAGYLVTDWGDRGHLQPLSVSYLGFAVAAACAWNPPAAEAVGAGAWPALLDLHCFESCSEGSKPSLGQCLYDLGNVYQAPGVACPNASILFRLADGIRSDLTHARYQDLTIDGLRSTRNAIDNAIDHLSEATGLEPQAKRVAGELLWSADMLRWVSQLGEARLERGRERPASDLEQPTRRRLQEQLGELEERRSRVWLERNRPGGWHATQAFFQKLQAALR